jgi:RHS repeat-associated protein
MIGAWEYRWYATGMLKEVIRPDGEVLSFIYDALNRRVAKTFKGNTTRWIWDKDVPLHEWVEETSGVSLKEEETALKRNNDGQLVAQAAWHAKLLQPVITWLFENDSYVPMAKLVGDTGYSIVADHNGVPVSMHDDGGNAVWSAEYDIYGKIRNLNGRLSACPFRYKGQYEDEETGLYYNRFRYYDAESGIYISQDPLGTAGSTNLYAYVQDVLVACDPEGLTDLDEGGFSVYALSDKKTGEVYYVGISNDADRRLGEHVDSGRLNTKTQKMTVLDNNLKYKQARGYEQAYIEHYKTKTGVFPANVVNSVDTSRTDDRGKAFIKEYNAKKKKLGCG